MDAKTICDICILNDVALQVKFNKKIYCSLEIGLGKLEGIYRKPNNDNNDIYGNNFLCEYKKIKATK